jgi:hypothetical protein
MEISEWCLDAPQMAPASKMRHLLPSTSIGRLANSELQFVASFCPRANVSLYLY